MRSRGKFSTWTRLDLPPTWTLYAISIHSPFIKMVSLSATKVAFLLQLDKVEDCKALTTLLSQGQLDLGQNINLSIINEKKEANVDDSIEKIHKKFEINRIPEKRQIYSTHGGSKKAALTEMDSPKAIDPAKRFLNAPKYDLKAEGEYTIDTKKVEISKEAVLLELDRIKDNICQYRSIVSITEDSVLYLVAKAGIYRGLRTFASRLANTDAALYVLQRFKFLKYLLLLTITLYLAFHSSYSLVLAIISLILVLRLDSKNNIRFYFIKYVHFDDERISGCQNLIKSPCFNYLRHQMDKNINKIFYRLRNPDNLVELQRLRRPNKVNAELEIYLLEFSGSKILRYFKIKITANKVVFQFFGRMSQEIYQQLELLALKIKVKGELREVRRPQIEIQKQFVDNQNEVVQAKLTTSADKKNKSEKSQSQAGLLLEKLSESDEINAEQLNAETRAFDEQNAISEEPNYQKTENDYRINDRNEFFIMKDGLLTEVKDQYSSQIYVDMLYQKVVGKFYGMLNDASIWRLDKQTDSYIIKSCQDNVFITVRTELQIKSDIKRVYDELSDISKICIYNPLVSSAVLVKNLTPDALISHVKVKCPFPLTNRDIVHIKISRWLSSKKAIILVTSAPDSILPPNSSHVRS